MTGAKRRRLWPAEAGLVGCGSVVVGRAGGVGPVCVVPRLCGVDFAPSGQGVGDQLRVARRCRLWAAARRLKSASTLVRPRTLARRPPWRRYMRWASFRSIFGLILR